MSQEHSEREYRVKKILRISAEHDIALFEINGVFENYLQIRGQELGGKENLVLLACPGGIFQEIRTRGEMRFLDDELSLFANIFPKFRGASGGLYWMKKEMWQECIFEVWTICCRRSI